MERKIKFRAWHFAEKKMCEVDTLNSEGAFLIGVNKGEDTYYDDMVVIAPDNGRYCKRDEFALMQHIGLVDILGVEMYEGDIVRILAEDKNWNYLTIEYGIARRTLASGYTDGRNFEVDIPCFYFVNQRTGLKTFPIVNNYAGKHDLEMIHVIGNIYETGVAYEERD